MDNPDIISEILSYASLLPRYERVNTSFQEATELLQLEIKRLMDRDFPLWNLLLDTSDSYNILLYYLNKAALAGLWDQFLILVYRYIDDEDLLAASNGIYIAHINDRRDIAMRIYKWLEDPHIFEDIQPYYSSMTDPEYIEEHKGHILSPYYHAVLGFVSEPIRLFVLLNYDRARKSMFPYEFAITIRDITSDIYKPDGDFEELLNELIILSRKYPYLDDAGLRAIIHNEVGGPVSTVLLTIERYTPAIVDALYVHEYDSTINIPAIIMDELGPENIPLKTLEEYKGELEPSQIIAIKLMHGLKVTLEDLATRPFRIL